MGGLECWQCCRPRAEFEEFRSSKCFGNNHEGSIPFNRSIEQPGLGEE
jgi:hypothetical protein